jgi:hypothetical protein
MTPYASRGQVVPRRQSGRNDLRCGNVTDDNNVLTKSGEELFIAMNRFRVKKGSEEAFERVWLNRDTQLTKVPGFANPIEAPAHTVISRALSPDAALAKIEEVRRSLLELAASPSLAPSPTPEEPTLPSVAAEPRPVEKLAEGV